MDAPPKQLRWADRTWALAAGIETGDNSRHVFAKVEVSDIVYSNYAEGENPTFNEFKECEWETAGTRCDRLFYVQLTDHGERESGETEPQDMY